jgi:four helix bundle protein
MAEKIKHFTDLVAWQKGHKLALMIYSATRSLPAEEKFGLVSQMRRAAVSVSSNIAEGFGRSTAREKIRFHEIAIGSLYELESQTLISRDLGYISEIGEALELIHEIEKIIHTLIKTASDRKLFAQPTDTQFLRHDTHY